MTNRPPEGRIPLSGEDPYVFVARPEEQRGGSAFLLPGSLDAFARSHDLTISAKGLLAWLALYVDFRSRVFRFSIRGSGGLAEYLGLGHSRLRHLLRELQQAGAIDWSTAPGRRDNSCLVEVVIYRSLVAGSSKNLHGWVPVMRSAFEAFCGDHRTDFDDRIALLLLVLAADERTQVVARDLNDLARVLGGVPWRRAKTLVDLRLRGCFQTGPAGLKMTVYPQIVDCGQQPTKGANDANSDLSAHDRDLSALSRQNMGPDANSTADRDLSALDRDLSALDRDLSALDRDLSAHDRDLSALSRQNSRRDPLILNPVIPNLVEPDPEPAATIDPETVEGEVRIDPPAEAKATAKGEAAVLEVEGKVVAVLGRRGFELALPAQAGGRCTFRQLVAERLGSSWEIDELVEHLTTNFGDPDSAVARLIKRLRESIPTAPPRVQVEEQRQAADLARQLAAQKRAQAEKDDRLQAEEARRLFDEGQGRRDRNQRAVSDALAALGDDAMDAAVQQQQIQRRRLGRPNRSLRLIEQDFVRWACQVHRARPDLPLVDALGEALATGFELVEAEAEEFELPALAGSALVVDLSERVTASLDRLERQRVPLAEGA
jgi:hypothetical protein